MCMYIIKYLLHKKKFKLIANIFNKNYTRSVLLCYLNKSAYYSSSASHPNKQEAKVIAKLFDKLGYNVDIIGDLYKKNILYDKYDILFGNGYPFENSFNYNKHNLKRIYYAAGAHTCQRNTAELERLQDLKQRKCVILRPKRLKHYPDWLSSALSDSICVIGNNWTKSTYKRYFKGPIYKINTSIYDYLNDVSIYRNWNTAKFNFLWLGSYGLVLKGLDLCIDAFDKIKNLNLHICGPMEKEFYEIYKTQIVNNENIYYYGFLDINTDRFKSIISQCGFVLHPSASEGQSTSLLTAMYSGLIPIATKESGVDLDDFGIYIDELSVEHIYNIINNVIAYSNEFLYTMSSSSQTYVRNNHHLINFESSLYKAFNNTLIENV